MTRKRMEVFILRVTSRLIAGSTVIVAAAGIGIGATASNAHAQNTSSGRTIVLYSAGGTETDVNVAGTPSLAPGDEAIEAQPVFNAANRTQQLGQGYVLFTVLTATTANLHSVISLKDGQIVLDGLKPIAGEAALVAVTGGTGIYQGAGGQASVQPATGTRAAIITIELTAAR
jgi:hypothetical protein